MDGLPKFANVLNETRPRFQEATFEIGPNGMGLDLLRAVYRNPSVDLHIRMRAAAMCLPFESPKLSMTAVIDNDRDFGAILDRRIKHMNELNGVKVIEATSARAVEARPPMPIKLLRRI